MGNSDYLHVSCLIDYLKGRYDPEITKSAEAISVSSVINENPEENNFAIQYTHGVGNFARNLAKHEFKTALLFDSQEAFDFTSELLEEDDATTRSGIMLIEDTIPVQEQSFPLSPDGKGWKLVVLDDILGFVGADSDLTTLLRSIASTMKDNGFLIMKIADYSKQKSWSKEYNDTVVTESIEKTGIRKFKRAFSSHGNIDLRHEENIFAFDVSDLHECARNACFRPTRDLGLDPAVWCCYEKI